MLYIRPITYRLSPGRSFKLPKEPVPPAPFTFTCEEKKIADDRLQSFGVLPRSFFYKALRWHQEPYLVQDVHYWNSLVLLGHSQRESLVAFLVDLEEIFAPSVDMERFRQLDERWHVAISR